MEEDSADSLYNPSSSEGEEPSPFQSEQMHEYFVGTRNQLVTCIHRTLPELNPFPSEVCFLLTRLAYLYRIHAHLWNKTVARI